MNAAIATTFSRPDDKWAETLQMSPLVTLGLYAFMMVWILSWAFVLYRRAQNPRQEITHLETLSQSSLEDGAESSLDDGERWKTTN